MNDAPKPKRHFWRQVNDYMYMHPLIWLYSVVDSAANLFEPKYEPSDLERIIGESREEEEEYKKAINDAGLSGYKEEIAFTIARRAGEFLCFRFKITVLARKLIKKSDMHKIVFPSDIIDNEDLSFLIVPSQFYRYLHTAVHDGIMCADVKVYNDRFIYYNEGFWQEATHWLRDEIAKRIPLGDEVELLSHVGLKLDEKKYGQENYIQFRTLLDYNDLEGRWSAWFKDN